MMAVKGWRLNDPESTERQAGVTWRARHRVSERVCVCVYVYSVVGNVLCACRVSLLQEVSVSV